MKAELPHDEPERLAALHGYEVLDTPPEAEYDDIVRIASVICGTPIAVVSLIDEARQWFKARVGLEGSETPRDLAFCAHAILKPKELLVVPDATTDGRFADSPFVTGDPGIRFYAGAPLVAPGGTALGTLCVIDREPRELTAEQSDALRALSRQVMALLELRRALAELRRNEAERRWYERHLEDYQRELEETISQLHSQSMTDPLTGLGNRRALQWKLDEELHRATRHGGPSTLLLIDVDKFKSFNDTFGHPAGDEALKSVAEVLRTQARTTDMVARYGGEEFAILLPNTGREGALILAERTRRAVERYEWPRRAVTVSIGAATSAPSVSDSAVLTARADKALYAAKQGGRNRVVHAG